MRADFIIIGLMILGGWWLWWLGRAGLVWPSLGQLSGITGIILMAANFVLAARWKWMEKRSGGLGRVYNGHHFLGAVAWVVLLAHPLLLSGQYLGVSVVMAMQQLLPDYGQYPVWLGIGALTTMIILLSITFFVKWEYQKWKISHRFLGVALVLAGLHVLFIPGNLSGNPWLRWYLLIWAGVGVYAWLYRIWMQKTPGTKREYKIIRVQKWGKNVAEIIMKPTGQGIRYSPGQFVFVEFETMRMAGEQHPFSITTAGRDGELGIAVKNLGDFTAKTMDLKPETKVWIEGPYGKFAQQFIKDKKQVWIGGGIGITPFVGMARGLVPGQLEKLDIFYVVSEREEAVLKPEGVSVRVWVSKERGRITGRAIADEIKDIKERMIMLCGPKPMMESLKKQFEELGVEPGNIVTEDFALYGDY